MKTFKKFVSLALVCVLALSMLTACGSSGSSSNSNKSFVDALNDELKPAGIAVTSDSKLSAKAEKFAAAVKALAAEEEIESFGELYEYIYDSEDSDSVKAALMKEAGLDEKTEAPAILYGSTTGNLVETAEEIIEAKIDGYALVKSVGEADADILGVKCQIVVLSYETIK